MKMDEINKLKDAEIHVKLSELKKSLVEMKLQSPSGELKDVKAISKARKDVARLNTVLNLRKQESENA